MTLPPPPPPRIPAPAVVNPNYRPGGDERLVLDPRGPSFDVLGATPAEQAVVEATLWNDPTEDPLGSYQLMSWDKFIYNDDQIPFVTIEFVAPAVVVAHAAGMHGEVPFAVTLWNQSAASADPPFGASAYGYVYPDYFEDQPLCRVLIRNDLLTGGAGAQWAGENFLAETIQHEMGHIAQYFLIDLYGSDYVIGNTCAIFGRPTSAWTAGTWENRVIEASAEAYKDLMLPARRYDNRTNVQLPFVNFPDFLTLYDDYANTSYWDAGNRDSMFARYLVTGPFPQVDGGFQPSFLFLRDGAPGVNPEWWDHIYGSGRYTYGGVPIMRVPDGDDPKFTLRWNFPWPLLAVDPDLSLDEKRLASAKDYDHVKYGVRFVNLEWAYSNYFGDGNPATDVAPPQEIEINPVADPSGTGQFDITLPEGIGVGFVLLFTFPGNPPWEFEPSSGLTNTPQLEIPFFLGGGFGSPTLQQQYAPWVEWGPIRTARFPRSLAWPYATGHDVVGTMALSTQRFGRARL